jgi:hypothetical protein
MFFIAFVLFGKNLFEPLCLLRRSPIIRGGVGMTDRELLATRITPERAHFLKTLSRFLSCLASSYCHCVH